MTTATRKPRRKATRTKRGRPAVADYPMPFSELPKRLQERAIESFQNDPDNCWSDHDSQFLTENLVNDLEYEFNITVSETSRPCSNGKTYSEPELYWDHYHRTVEFTADVDLDELFKHAAEGCEYFQPTIAALQQLYAEAIWFQASEGLDLDWTFHLREDHRHDIYDRASYAACDRHEEHQEELDRLARAMDECLGEIYAAACRRCLEIIDAEIDYHYSDEYIHETLQNNDQFEFDEDGDFDMNRGEHKLREIAAAVKRLKASDTPIKRRNALKAFARAVKDLEASVAAAFPKLRPDGSAIVRRKARGARCPLCKVPMKSFVMLVEHLFQRHHVHGGIVNDRTCVCGKRLNSPAHLAKHLAGVGDLRIHFAEAAMQKATGLL